MDDHPRYVQFCAYGPGMVRCEVVGNAYLPPNMRHCVGDLVSLRMMGWRLPAEVQNEVGDSGSPNLFMDVHADETARAAEATITTFREIWGVASPDGIVTDAEMLRGRHAFRSCVRPVPEAARI